MKIITDFWMKPIPSRQFDWSATDDNYEPGCPIGSGATEQEAPDGPYLSCSWHQSLDDAYRTAEALNEASK